MSKNFKKLYVVFVLLLTTTQAYSNPPSEPDRQSQTRQETPKKISQTQRRPLMDLRLQWAPVAIFMLIGKEGFLGVEGMFHITENISAGPALSYVNLTLSGFEQTSLNIGGRIDFEFFVDSFEKPIDSWYVSNFIKVGSFTSEKKETGLFEDNSCDRTYTNKGTTIIVGALLGKKLVWENNLSITFGAGWVATKTLSDSPKNESTCARDTWDLKTKPYEGPWFDLGIGIPIG